MSTSLHAVFNVVFGNVYFIVVNFNIRGRKMRFSEISQTLISEKIDFWSFAGHFSQRIKFFQGGGGILLLVQSNKSILTKK